MQAYRINHRLTNHQTVSKKQVGNIFNQNCVRFIHPDTDGKWKQCWEIAYLFFLFF